MSTVCLLKDYDVPGRSPGKKGELISVPFLLGKQLVADGTAEYPASVATPAVLLPPPEVVELRAAAAAKDKRIKELEEELAAKPHPRRG